MNTFRFCWANNRLMPPRVDNMLVTPVQLSQYPVDTNFPGNLGSFSDGILEITTLSISLHVTLLELDAGLRMLGRLCPPSITLGSMFTQSIQRAHSRYRHAVNSKSTPSGEYSVVDDLQPYFNDTVCRQLFSLGEIVRRTDPALVSFDADQYGALIDDNFLTLTSQPGSYHSIRLSFDNFIRPGVDAMDISDNSLVSLVEMLVDESHSVDDPSHSGMKLLQNHFIMALLYCSLLLDTNIQCNVNIVVLSALRNHVVILTTRQIRPTVISSELHHHRETAMSLIANNNRFGFDLSRSLRMLMILQEHHFSVCCEQC